MPGHQRCRGRRLDYSTSRGQTIKQDSERWGIKVAEARTRAHVLACTATSHVQKGRCKLSDEAEHFCHQRSHASQHSATPHGSLGPARMLLAGGRTCSSLRAGLLARHAGAYKIKTKSTFSDQDQAGDSQGGWCSGLCATTSLLSIERALSGTRWMER